MDIATEHLSLSLSAETVAGLRSVASARNASIHNLADRMLRDAIAIEAATAGETGTGSTEGESAGRDSDIAQPKSGPSHD